jgi:protein transport protein SEC39
MTVGYTLATKLYLKSSNPSLSTERVGEVVLHEAMAAYDSASNGNKTRGAMKKANDMSDSLQPYDSASCANLQQNSRF